MPLLPLLQDLVYGPVRSRRLGWSLGINVFPPGRKICNFNCAYCQYGWTCEGETAVRPDEWPAPGAITEAVRASLGALQAAHRRVDRLTLAGNGEPTLHPSFGEIVEGLRAVRDDLAPDVRLAVLSNAGTLDRPAVVAAMRRVDSAYLKLDSADPDLFRRMNGGTARLPKILEALCTLSHVTIQSLFTRDAARRIDNTTADAIDHWLEALKAIGPEAVHVYTIDRAPAWSALEKVPRSELEAIAARVKALGIPVMVF